MCDRPAAVSSLCPRVEIVTISLVMLGLACLNKIKNKNNNNNQKEAEHSGILVSWRFTTLAKLSVHVSDVVSLALSRKGL